MRAGYVSLASACIAVAAGFSFASADAPAARAQDGSCAAAKTYIDEQVAAGRSLTTFSGEEARWAVKARLDPAFLSRCTSVPQALQARIRGEYPDTGEHQRMNCHLAFDYLITEGQSGAHKQWPQAMQDEERGWASSYARALDSKQACPAPPEMLAARATGHLVSTPQGRNALNNAHAAGDSDATLEVCMVMMFGKGVPKDVSTGLAYLTKAAEMGNPWAQYELALFHMLDKIEGGSKVQGFALMKQSAEAGVPPAMRLLSTYHAQGQGTRVDGREALAWARKAGEAGEVVATGYAGSLLLRGAVLPKNEKEGRRLIEAAARAGDSNAMTVLAGLLAQQDNAWKRSDQVWYWYRRARDRGNPTATDFLAKHETDLKTYLAKPEPVPYRPKRQYCPIKSSCIRYVHHRSGTSFNSCNTGPDYWNCRDID